MAANAYLQGAAAQVVNAANDLERQIKQAQSEFEAYKRETERQIVQLQTDHAGLQAQESSTSDSNERDDLKRQENDLQKQIDQMKQDLHQRQNEIQQTVQGKMEARNGLNQMSKDVYNQAADPNLQ